MAYDTIPSEEIIQKAIAGLTPRNVAVHLVETAAEALLKVRSLIPDGAEVMTGASVTLEQIGFAELLQSGQHPWKSLKDAITAEADPSKRGELRKRAVLSEYFLGSVHAIAEDGQVIIASNTGSQLPSYAFTSENVIWVAGAHKIVPTLEEGFKRIRDYVFPLEDEHMRQIGYPGSAYGKFLIFEKENMPNRRINLVLVKEVLGF